MEATVRWRDGVSFEVESGTGHVVTTDGPPDSGGRDLGPRPMELVLMGTGGCASFDVVDFLRKGRQDVVGCECRLSAERVDAVPAVFSAIHMHFVVTGHDLSESKVARAVTLSADKYCSASIMLAAGGVQITHTWEIVAADQPR